MFHLHDVVRLKEDNKEYGIPSSALGAIVDVLGGGMSYVVEFIDDEGNSYEDALSTEFSEDELESATEPKT